MIQSLRQPKPPNLVQKYPLFYNQTAISLKSAGHTQAVSNHVVTSAFVAASVEEFGEVTLEQITHQNVCQVIKASGRRLVYGVEAFSSGPAGKTRQ